MSNLLKAEATKKAKGSPISKDVDTVTFRSEESMNADAGVGGGLTYFNGKFNQPNSSNGQTDKPIHKVEAYIGDLSNDPLNNTATGYLNAKLNSENDNAEVEIQSYLIAEMSSKEGDSDNNFQIINVEGHNNDSITQQFNDDILDVKLVLSGFTMSYSNEHWIKKLTAASKNENFDSGTQLFSFDIDAQMIDDSDHKGGGDLFMSLIGSNATDTPWDTQTWHPGDGEATASFTGSTPLETAYVFIQGLQLKYKSGEDHKVKKITANTGTDELYISKNEKNSDGTYTWEVTFKPKLEMKDDSGNEESKSNSYLDLLVIFVPTNEIEIP